MLHTSATYALVCERTSAVSKHTFDLVGVYVEEGPDRDALTAALARENYLPVYLDPRTVLKPLPPSPMQASVQLSSQS